MEKMFQTLSILILLKWKKFYKIYFLSADIKVQMPKPCDEFTTQDIFDNFMKLILEERLQCDSDNDIKLIIKSVEKYKADSNPCNVYNFSKVVDFFIENLRRDGGKRFNLCAKLERYKLSIKDGSKVYPPAQYREKLSRLQQKRPQRKRPKPREYPPSLNLSSSRNQFTIDAKNTELSYVSRIGNDFLISMPETTFVSKNKKLQDIFFKIWDGDLIEGSELLTMIRGEQWEKLDSYFRSRSSIENFSDDFALICRFFHKDKSINYKALQNALGIQQMVWSVNPLNSLKMTFDVSLHIWNSANTTQLQTDTLNVIMKRHIDDRLTEKTNIRQLDEYLNGSIWYLCTPFKQPGTWKFTPGKTTLYAIPQSLDFSPFACIYPARIVLGVTKSCTLTSFIIKNKKRLYNAHHPLINSNLKNIHSFDNPIYAIWYHDFFHSKSGNCSRDLSYLNHMGVSEKDADILIKDGNVDSLRKMENGEKICGAVNDTGTLWDQNEIS